jgi:hypothetical protein
VTYEKSCLGNTQKHSADDKTLIAGDSGGTDGDDTPRDHNSTDPLAWREVFHAEGQ